MKLKKNKELGGVEGDDGEAKQNLYDMLMEYLINEIEKMLEKCAQQVCFPPK